MAKVRGEGRFLTSLSVENYWFGKRVISNRKGRDARESLILSYRGEKILKKRKIASAGRWGDAAGGSGRNQS